MRCEQARMIIITTDLGSNRKESERKGKIEMDGISKKSDEVSKNDGSGQLERKNRRQKMVITTKSHYKF